MVGWGQDLVCPGRMHSLGENGTRRLRGHHVHVHLEDGC